MNDLISPSELMSQVSQLREKFEARPLMFGGDLLGIETFWHMLTWTEDLINGPMDHRLARRAYEVIAYKYKCGCWAISGKVKDNAEKKSWDQLKASQELMKKLKEVDKLAKEWRAEVEAYHFLVIEEAKEWTGLCQEFPFLSYVGSGRNKVLSGIKSMVAELIYELKKYKEVVPQPRA